MVIRAKTCCNNNKNKWMKYDSVAIVTWVVNIYENYINKTDINT
jgi:hypothetical protein